MFKQRDFTVIDRLDHKGVETTKNQRWELGAYVREKWRQRYGDLPRKELREKTNGHGSHCFAVYPESFVGVIDGIIDQYKLLADRQLDLFKPREEENAKSEVRSTTEQQH